MQHRDMRPDHDAPLELLLRDYHQNGLSYLQWNIALFDDDTCLHVVPGSHCRHTTSLEQLELQRDPQSEVLPRALNLHLNAGDGVAYINTILHRGSGYSPQRPRLTLHLAYRAFDRPLFPRSNVYTWDSSGPGIVGLPQDQRAQLQEMAAWQTEQMHAVTRLLRVMLDNSSGTPEMRLSEVQECLAALHPGKVGREVALVLCAVHLRDIIAFHRAQSHLGVDHDGNGNGSTTSHGGAPSYMETLAGNFSPHEIETLSTYFAPLERLLKIDRQSEPRVLHHVRGFLGPPTEYVYDRLSEHAARMLAPDGLDDLLRQMLRIQDTPDHASALAKL